MNEDTKAYKKARKKIKLYLKQKGKCYYCSRNMIMTIGFDYSKVTKQSLPPNIATIEHVYSRFESDRYDHSRNHGLNVLACYACNQKVGLAKELYFKNKRNKINE